MHLSSLPAEQAVGVLGDLLDRLLVPTIGPFTTLTEEAARWRLDLPSRWEAAGRPFDRRLIDAALELLDELASPASPCVLLHQDLHGDNVLSAQREPWLAIDPKPLVGDRAFAPAPVVRSHELGHSRAPVRWRLDHLSERLQVDRDRVQRWTFAQTVAWAIDDDARTAHGRHVETAQWLLDT